MSDAINIGTLQADLDLNTTRLERGTANAENALYQIRKELREVTAAFNAGMMGAREYTDRMGYLRGAQTDLQSALLNANGAIGAQEAALNQLVNAYGNAAGSRGSGGGGGANALTAAQRQLQQQTRMTALAMMQLGYMADDVQYGFRSIVNNIGPLTYAMTTAFGGTITQGFAVGAVLQVIAVGAYQAYTQWDRLMGVMDIGVVRTEAEQMAELGKQTEKTAEETAKLNKYKKEQHDISQMMEKESKEQKDRKHDAEELIAESGDEKATGGEKLVAAIVNSRKAKGQQTKSTEAEKKDLNSKAAIENIINTIKSPFTGGALFPKKPDGIQVIVDKLKDKEQERLDNADVERAKKLALSAKNGDTNAQRELLNIIKDPSKHQGERDKLKAEIDASIDKGEKPDAAKMMQLGVLDQMISADRKAGRSEQTWKRFAPGAEKDISDMLPENRKQQELWEKQGAARAHAFKLKMAQDKKDEAKAEADRKKSEAAEDKAAGKGAQDIGRGSTIANLLEGKHNLEDTYDALEKSGAMAGMSDEDKARHAVLVHSKLGDKADEKVREHAAAHDLNADDAKREVVADIRQKAETDAAKRAEQQAPGIQKYATNMIAGAAASGDPRNMEVVRRQIAMSIHAQDMVDKKQDLNEQQVGDATKGIIDKATHTVNEKLADKLMNPDNEKKTKSEQFKAEDLATKIQSGVGPLDEQKKSNTYLDKAVKLLQQMAVNGGNRANPFVVN